VTGGGQSVGLQVAPGWKVPLAAAHWAAVPWKQLTVVPGMVAQHAPVTGGQVLAVQVVLGPCQAPLSAVHWACVRIRHCVPPSTEVTQHAPVGAQVTFAHVVPACHVPPRLVH